MCWRACARVASTLHLIVAHTITLLSSVLVRSLKKKKSYHDKLHSGRFNKYDFLRLRNTYRTGQEKCCTMLFCPGRGRVGRAFSFTIDFGSF